MVDRSVDRLLPAALARAAGVAGELVRSPPAEQIRRRGDRRHRTRIAATVTGSLAGVALVGAAAMVALDPGRRTDQPIAPATTAGRASTPQTPTRTQVPPRTVPPGTKVRIASAMLLPPGAVPGTPAGRPWTVVPVLAGGETNCGEPGDYAVVGAQRAVSQKYLVDVPGAGTRLDSASEALYETADGGAARNGYQKLVAEPNLCPATPRKAPGAEIRGNGGAGRVWFTGGGSAFQAYVGVGYKANVVVVVNRLVYPRSGVAPVGAAAAEQMLLNALARIG